ncbi:MAG: tetrathionate reductase family octaheme c-type cytochrome [Ignavibacteriales bacterium]|nr:tetrathionate reductase family octaheme c-type cytochrome [Ignavibacteriales bacterium]
MKKPIILFLVIAGILLLAIIAQTHRHRDPSPLLELKQKYSQRHIPSVDHTKLPALQKKFSTPQEVTLACISCHTERHKEVMRSSHWNWEREEYVPGRGITYLGKKNALNNYCIGTEGNEQSCAKCHIGYGMTDAKFGFDNPAYVDCLACHDNSSKYVKASEQAGKPEPALNLADIAQHVGSPQRTNCGTCHFFGGGGNNVKHGDLDKAMFDPSKDLDVHMSAETSDLQCPACHITKNHKMAGKMYSLSSMNRNRSTCEQCHTDRPHDDGILNEHTVKVSCQACHIPQYAKANATKVYWDWSTAGKMKNGEPYIEEDSDGNHAYMSIKGSFTWGKNLQPEYAWFNGTAGHYLLGDTITPYRTISINTLYGRYDDPDAKIIPVKIHRAKQIYDPQTKMLIQPILFGTEKGKGAYWKDFDWKTASAEGMKKVGLPFSGSYTFVETEMYWPVNHQVSPKNRTVPCSECHTRINGRLQALKDFYMPGRDYNAAIEWFGRGAILLSLLGVAAHALLRFVAARKRRIPSGGGV